MQAIGCPCCYAHREPFSAADPFDFTSGRRTGATTSKREITPRVWNDVAAERETILDGATVVDPSDGTTAANVSIRIRDGRIVDVGPSGATREDPAAARIDVSGKFVVPGYNDMHSHALNLRNPSGSLALMLAEGVTGFRQMSGSPALLQARANGTLPIGSAAPGLLATPGTVLTPLNAGSAGAAAQEIHRQHDQGADFVKLVLTSPDVFFAAVEEAKAVGLPIVGHLQDGVDAVAAAQSGFHSIEHLGPGSSVWASCSTDGDDIVREGYEQPTISLPPFKIPFLDRIVMWRMQGLLVNPAAYSSRADVERIQRAVDTYSDDRAAEVAARFIEHGTWQVPTMVRLRTMEYAGAPEYDRSEFLGYMPTKNVKRWRRVTKKFQGLPAECRATYRTLYSRQLGLTKLFADKGVRMMTGTDGGFLSGPGLTLREEFAELAEAGLSPLKILQMTTVDPAEFLGRQDTMGPIAPGRNADLVVLDANPLDSVANLHRIHAVVRSGNYFSAAKLATLKSSVAAGRGRVRTE